MLGSIFAPHNCDFDFRPGVKMLLLCLPDCLLTCMPPRDPESKMHTHIYISYLQDSSGESDKNWEDSEDVKFLRGIDPMANSRNCFCQQSSVNCRDRCACAKITVQNMSTGI